jgi:hypothetical protein
MKKIAFLILIAFCFSCGRKVERKDQVILDRIEYVYNLKSFIDKNVWERFDDKKFDVPLIYYTDTNCYVANPTERFINLYNLNLVFENNHLKIYETYLLDSVPFHMEVSVSFDSVEDYTYKSPFMKCSSVEITNKLIPDVPCTEVWATMILHEYFHGFQFKHPKFFDYFSATSAYISPDTLRNIYSHNKWFKESVNKENELLLSALISKDSVKTASLINLFFQLREQRRNNTKQLTNFDIKPIENIYETMEGTARYVEYNLYNKFPTKQSTTKLMKSDTFYGSYAYFDNFNFEEAQWLYKTGRDYFYATGFNITRLLDKLKIEYKSRLFKEGGISLEEILKEEYGT